MDFEIRIAREVVGITGYKTLEYLSCHPMTDENLEMVKQMKVKRKFWYPFNSSILIVVVE